MRPILFTIFGWEIPSYGVFLTLAYVSALLLARKLAEKKSFARAAFVDGSLVALLAGIIGARILFVALNWSFFRERPLDALSFWNGGLVFYGGLLAALPAVFFFFRAKKIAPLAAFDTLAPSLALGQAIGRVGCFLAGCCYGRLCPYPWGLHFSSELVEPALRGQSLHPTQLYESFGLGLLTLGLLALFFRRPSLRAGTVTYAYLMGAAALRFFVEFFRGDEIRGTVSGTPFSISQLIALLLFLGGGCLLARAFRRDH